MTQHEAQRANFGPSWPEVAGFGAAGPNKQFLSFPARENLKNVQVSRHLPCLPFSGKLETRYKHSRYRQNVGNLLTKVLFAFILYIDNLSVRRRCICQEINTLNRLEKRFWK